LQERDGQNGNFWNVHSGKRAPYAWRRLHEEIRPQDLKRPGSVATFGGRVPRDAAAALQSGLWRRSLPRNDGLWSGTGGVFGNDRWLLFDL